MRIHLTPGVYSQAADASAAGVAPMRTDVAGFVGIAQRGPLHLAVPVESYRQFVVWFGDAFDNGYLAYCARGFFENGGRRLWAVRVASPAASAASRTLADALGPAWRVQASSPGVWGHGLEIRVVEVRHHRVHATLNALDPCRLDGGPWAGFARWDMVELVRGAERVRAVVADVATEPLAVAAAAGRNPATWLRLTATPIPALAAGVPELRVETIAYNLEIFEGGRLLDVVTDLSLVPQNLRYGPRVLKMPWSSNRTDELLGGPPRVAEADLAVDHFRVARNRTSAPPPPVVVQELRDAAQRDALNPLLAVAGAAASPRQHLNGGADGLAALTAFDFIGKAAGLDSSLNGATEAALTARRGLAALAINDDVGLIAVPCIHIRPDPTPTYLTEVCVPDRCLPQPQGLQARPPQRLGDSPPLFSAADIAAVQVAQVQQCEQRRDRFALLDAPAHTCTRLSFAVTELRDWRNRFDTAFAAMHAPWLKVVDPRRGTSSGRTRQLTNDTTRAIPPCGHVAGHIASTDLRQGVHHAPANVPLAWVQDLTLAIDDERHGLLNALGVNVIRAVDGRGLRVLGARTLSSDNDWRFINVRRLMSMIERAIDISLQWAVFEPNDWRTRMKICLVVGGYLRALWNQGALAGAVIEQAFFVRCDDGNNTANVRDAGRLVLDIGVAPVSPFEFVVLRIGRDSNGFALTEQGSAFSQHAA